MKNSTLLALLVSSYWLFLVKAKVVHDCDHVCPDVSQPVCGSNGETYKSKCLLRLQKCISRGKLHVAYNGPCKVRPTCKQERNRIIKSIERGGLLMLGILIPDCDENGGYSTVQCHRPSQTCWCADKFGYEVDNTRVRFKKPDCRGRSPRSHPRKLSNERYARILKGCNKENRISFNKKVVANFKKEMAKFSKKKGKSDATEIVQWKMRELDTDNSGNLQHKEVKALIKKLKKAYPPRKCGKTLFYYCDKDQNDVISRKEWLNCLGVQGSNTKSSARPDVSRCLKEHLKASELEARDPNPGRFIPSCNADGTYTSVQCQKLSKYCWCVNPITGRNIPSTSVKNARPDCSKHAHPTPVSNKRKKRPTIRPKVVHKPQFMPAKTEKSNVKIDRGKKHKECDDSSWVRFSQEFLQYFRKELELMTKSRLRGRNMTAENSRPPNLLHAISQRLPDTMILAWAFSQLDMDRDRQVSVNELFVGQMKKVYGRIRRGRKCSKKLATSCDYDKNRRLSLGEWRKCLRRRLPRSSKSPFSRPGFIGR